MSAPVCAPDLRRGAQPKSSALDEPGGNHTVDDAKDLRNHFRLGGKEVAKLIGHTEHPLANRALWKDLIDQVGGTVRLYEKA